MHVLTATGFSTSTPVIMAAVDAQEKLMAHKRVNPK